MDFSTVLRVFEDPNRLIIPNLKHSPEERKRRRGFGLILSGVMSERGSACSVIDIGAMPTEALGSAKEAHRR